MTIGINPGHTVSGQPGCGAVGLLDESVETRNVGKALMSLFRVGGHTVVDCTDDYADSVNENLNTITALANAQTLDLFVSIHFNSGGGKGTEVYTYGGAKHTEAVNVCSRFSALGFVNRGVKDGSNLAVIRRSNAKAMLIEVCFVDTQSDVDLYRRIGAEKIAQEIYTAITGETAEEGEELTVTQYEELKALITAQNEAITDLKAKAAQRTGYYNYIDENMPESYKPTIRKLVSAGYLQGNENGELMLTVDMMRILTILDRAGVFS